MMRAWSRGRITGTSKGLQLLRYKAQAHLRDAARFRARSTSHAVAAHSSCTKIPLSAGRAPEDENHSRKRHFRPWLATVRLPGSARTDQVLGDDGITLIYSLGNLHRVEAGSKDDEVELVLGTVPRLDTIVGDALDQRCRNLQDIR
jgi:hypothetical protein